MVVNDELVFIHLQKCGGTFINNLLIKNLIVRKLGLGIMDINQ